MFSAKRMNPRGIDTHISQLPDETRRPSAHVASKGLRRNKSSGLGRVVGEQAVVPFAVEVVALQGEGLDLCCGIADFGGY